MGAGAPKGNTNAEKWTEEEAISLFNTCLEYSKDLTSEDNDFIGEVAQLANTTLSTLDYLHNKYPSLKTIYKDIKSNCETNCFRNGKKGKINSALAIMNLKSNHGWTDRLDNTTKDEPIVKEIDYTKLSTEALKEIASLKSK